jgi:hypothetical protein
VLIIFRAWSPGQADTLNKSCGSDRHGELCWAHGVLNIVLPAPQWSDVTDSVWLAALTFTGSVFIEDESSMLLCI